MKTRGRLTAEVLKRKYWCEGVYHEMKACKGSDTKITDKQQTRKYLYSQTIKASNLAGIGLGLLHQTLRGRHLGGRALLGDRRLLDEVRDLFLPDLFLLGLLGNSRDHRAGLSIASFRVAQRRNRRLLGKIDWAGRFLGLGIILTRLFLDNRLIWSFLSFSCRRRGIGLFRLL